MADAAPRLSVCVIARNEAERLPRCLASVADVADEVLVTDTGSTDDTVAIAEAEGAVVDRFAWVDDFSAAYNHCVARARGDWVLLLDADEQLLPASRDEVRRLVGRDDAFAFSVLRQDLADADRPDHFTEMLQTRLFRPRESMRFVGRIHHQFTPPVAEVAAAEGRSVFVSTVRLRHDGYVGGDKVPKLRRAERLMALELEDRPDRFYFLVELGRTRIALGDESGVALLRRAAEQVVADDPQTHHAPGQLATLLEHLLACDVLPEGFPLSLTEAERLAAERFPASVPLLWQRAQRQFKAGRFGECAELLGAILDLAGRDAYDRSASFDPDLLGGRTLLNLGVCHARRGDRRAALGCFDRLADDSRYGEAARANAAALRRRRR